VIGLVGKYNQKLVYNGWIECMYIELDCNMEYMLIFADMHLCNHLLCPKQGSIKSSPHRHCIEYPLSNISGLDQCFLWVRTNRQKPLATIHSPSRKAEAQKAE
jgi:hypothetical protein